MRRGSTPTNVFKTNLDLKGAKVYLTFSQNGRVVFEQTNKDLKIKGDMVISRLRQKDTLAFDAKCHTVQMQLRYVFADGTADASEIITCPIGDVLKDGEIRYD